MIRFAGSVLIKNKHVILAKRASALKNFPNLFEFPGGKIEKDESPKQALVRELEEELKIKVEIDNIIEFPNNTHVNILENDRELILRTLFIIKKWQGEISINDQIHSDLAYVRISELANFKGFIPGDELIVKKIIASL